MVWEKYLSNQEVLELISPNSPPRSITIIVNSINTTFFYEITHHDDDGYTVKLTKVMAKKKQGRLI